VSSSSGVPARPDPTEGPRVTRADEWFRRFPTGGTVFRESPTAYAHPTSNPVSHDFVKGWFRNAPNGGGTVFERPSRDTAVPPSRDDSARVSAVDPGRFVERPTGGGTVFERPEDGGENGDA
jgi:hypothetical protein